MIRPTTFILPFGTLLFIQACNGLLSSPIPSAPPAVGSGPRTVGNFTYTVLCETVDHNAVAPYVTAHLPTNIQDFDTCMELCSDFGDGCEIALWDDSQANPCTLLTAVAANQAPPAPKGRCYAAKFKGSVAVSVSLIASLSAGAGVVAGGALPTGISLTLPSSVLLSDGSVPTGVTLTLPSTALEALLPSSISLSLPSIASDGSLLTSVPLSLLSSASEAASLATPSVPSAALSVGATGIVSAKLPVRTDLLCGPQLARCLEQGLSAGRPILGSMLLSLRLLRERDCILR